MIYLLNTPILTAFGHWHFCGPLSVEAARARLCQPFQSAIGHASSAQLLTRLLQIDVPVNRIAITMAPGDCALVLRVLGRLPEGAVLSATELESVRYELGWLERTA
jgi:hypothetical protein